MECAWQCEIDEQASAVLARHWPTVKRYTDVRNITSGNTEPVDVICGGFPCQDVSVAGKRAGLAGKRSGLWFEFHRILSELRPGWVVIENVPGLLSSNGGRDFAVILRGLVELGYGVAWRILDAQYFGVAQRRRRVFIVGSLGSGRAAEVLFEREGGSRDTPPRRQTGSPTTELAGTLAANAGGTNRPAGNANEPDFCVVAATLNSGGNSGGFRTEPGEHLVARSLTSRQSRLDGDADNFVAFQQNTRDEVRLMGGDGAIAGALAAEPGMHQQNFVAMPQGAVGTLRADAGAPKHAADEGKLVIGFMPRRTDAGASEEMIPTMNTGNGGMGAPGDSGSTGVRRLMPVECERLQGFPDGWTAGGADSSRYKQLGNAVEVDCAAWIGRHLLAALPPVTLSPRDEARAAELAAEMLRKEGRGW